MEHTVDDTAKAIVRGEAYDPDDMLRFYTGKDFECITVELPNLQTLAQHWLDTHAPKLYACTRCEVEYDTCLELNSFKINDVEHSICSDCLRKWLGEEDK